MHASSCSLNTLANSNFLHQFLLNFPLPLSTQTSSLACFKVSIPKLVGKLSKKSSVVIGLDEVAFASAGYFLLKWSKHYFLPFRGRIRPILCFLFRMTNQSTFMFRLTVNYCDRFKNSTKPCFLNYFLTGSIVNGSTSRFFSRKILLKSLQLKL